MRKIKELIDLDYSIFNQYYKMYIMMMLLMALFFAKVPFNMGLMMLIMFYSITTDKDYKQLNSKIQIMPINNKEYVVYKYTSLFLRLLMVIIMFLIFALTVFIAEQIINAGSSNELLLYLSERMLIENQIQSNFGIRFLAELYVAIITISVIVPTQYMSKKRDRVLVWLCLFVINGMVGSFITRYYTSELIDFLGKFNILALCVFAIVTIICIVCCSYKKTLKLYSKAEIL